MHRRPVHRLRRHRARPRPGGAPLPGARRGAVGGRAALDPQERAGVQGGPAPGRRPDRVPRPRRPGRPGHLQPAVHPAHGMGVRRPRGARLRPGTGAVLGRGRPRPDPRHRTHRAPAAAPRRGRRHRARRHPGRSGAVDLHRGAGLGRRGGPSRPQQPAAVRHRPQGAAVSGPTSSFPQYPHEEAR
ncbi:hypothetical protein SGPA1_11765 [Streptomyces misionensis JCM 4497]